MCTYLLGLQPWAGPASFSKKGAGPHYLRSRHSVPIRRPISNLVHILSRSEDQSVIPNLINSGDFRSGETTGRAPSWVTIRRRDSDAGHLLPVRCSSCSRAARAHATATTSPAGRRFGRRLPRQLPACSGRGLNGGGHAHRVRLSSIVLTNDAAIKQAAHSRCTVAIATLSSFSKRCRLT